MSLRLFVRHLSSQLRLDARVAYRGRFVHVVVAVALLFGALVRFGSGVAPDGEMTIEVWESGPVESAKRAVVDGADAVVLSDAVVVDAAAPAHTELLALSRARNAEDSGSPVRVLRPDTPAISGASLALPLLFGMDVAIIGFLLAGVMLLADKQHGTVYFYRVTSASTWPYVLSKAIVNVALAALNTAILFAVAEPAQIGSFAAWAILMLAVLTLSLLGVGMAVHFRNLSSFFYPLTALALVLQLPMLPYLSPGMGWADWLAFLPTHAVMFGGRLALAPGSGSFAWLEYIWIQLPALALCAAFAGWSVHRRLLREGL